MPVNTTHDDYACWSAEWQKCRDAVAGQRAVHERGEVYLPKLSGQDKDQYNAYKLRALYYNATGRTLDGLTGLVFRRPPTIELPAALDFMSQDVDSAGLPLLTLCEKAVDDLQAVGRFGLLVDYTNAEGLRTQAEEAAAGVRPNIVRYEAESIINWRRGKIANAWQLTLVVLHEKAPQATDPYKTTYVDQWRVLRLADGKYTIELYQKSQVAGSTEEFVQIGETLVPTMGAKPLDFIPFLICGPNGLSEEVAKPPLSDMADVNLSHYRSSADYEHGLHFTGLPTPIITGHQFGVGESLSLGSSQVTAFPSVEAKAFFLEFEGKGLDSLSTRLEEKESMMASLGARMLAPEKKAAEAADTAAIHRAGENSVLASLANAASAAITKALTWAAKWAGVAGDVRVELNTDYLPTGLSAQDVTALVMAWQSGAISHETLYDNLQRGEIAQQDIDFEAEKTRISEEPPKLGTLTDPNLAPSNGNDE